MLQHFFPHSISTYMKIVNFSSEQLTWCVGEYILGASSQKREWRAAAGGQAKSRQKGGTNLRSAYISEILAHAHTPVRCAPCDKCKRLQLICENSKLCGACAKRSTSVDEGNLQEKKWGEQEQICVAAWSAQHHSQLELELIAISTTTFNSVLIHSNCTSAFLSPASWRQCASKCPQLTTSPVEHK